MCGELYGCVWGAVWVCGELSVWECVGSCICELCGELYVSVQGGVCRELHGCVWGPHGCVW